MLIHVQLFFSCGVQIGVSFVVGPHERHGAYLRHDIVACYGIVLTTCVVNLCGLQGDAPAESEDAASQDAVQAAEPEAEAPAAAEPEVPAGAESEARAGAESEDPAAAAAADNPPEVVILEEYTTAELAQIGVFKKNWEVRTTDNN